jgi:putative Ca2+/H+ antiporter (TMEM165/GDT1 family)
VDWKVFATTFGTIFVAELGDKTQFAAVAASAGTSSKISVLLGVVLALSLAGVLGVAFGGVAFGGVLGQWLSPDSMKWISGILFIAVGGWILAFT